MADRLSLTNALAAADIDRGKAERIATEIFDAITGNVATKADLAELRNDIKGDVARLEARLDATATKSELADLRNDIKVDVARLEARLDATATKVELADLRAELQAVDQGLRAEVARLETRLTLRLGGAMAVLTGVALGLVRLMLHG